MLTEIKAIKQKGISLIEVLITTLILGIGLLGVAALQISGVSSNLEGFYTSQATSLAEDLATRIRSSRAVTMITSTTYRSSVSYDDYLTNYFTNADPVECLAAPTNCRSNGAIPADCSMFDLAQYDLQDVCWVAKQTLPDPKLRMINDGNRLSIIVDWASTYARADFGEVKNINSNCALVTGSSDRNCVLMELVP